MNPQMNQPNMGMYPNFNQPMSNPYTDRMAQLQNYQQSLQQPQIPQNQPQGLIGKAVNDFAEITANDVPMNGVSAIFPKTDLSEIQLRTWAANGTIQTITYKPILEQNQAEGTNIPQNDFTALNEDVRALREEISDRFDRLEKSMGGTSTKTNSRAKKGDSENE